MALRLCLNGSSRDEVFDPEAASDHITNKYARKNDSQNNTKSVGVGTQDNDLRDQMNVRDCRFISKIPKLISTKTIGIKWEQKLLSMDIKLEDLQTQLETQVKSIQDQIDSARNRQSTDDKPYD